MIQSDQPQSSAFCSVVFPNPRWYVLAINSRQAEKALGSLGSFGFEFYAPRAELTKKQHRGKFLFSGYVFVRTDPGRDAYKLKRIRGAWAGVGLVSFGGVPAPVPDEAIEDLKAREDPKTHLVRLGPRLREGSQVYVKYADSRWLGVLRYDLSDDQRAVVLLRWLLGEDLEPTLECKNKMTVQVPQTDVKPFDSNPRVRELKRRAL
jgi:hypothetical protein